MFRKLWTNLRANREDADRAWEAIDTRRDRVVAAWTVRSLLYGGSAMGALSEAWRNRESPPPLDTRGASGLPFPRRAEWEESPLARACQRALEGPLDTVDPELDWLVESLKLYRSPFARDYEFASAWHIVSRAPPAQLRAAAAELWGHLARHPDHEREFHHAMVRDLIRFQFPVVEAALAGPPLPWLPAANIDVYEVGIDDTSGLDAAARHSRPDVRTLAGLMLITAGEGLTDTGQAIEDAAFDPAQPLLSRVAMGLLRNTPDATIPEGWMPPRDEGGWTSPWMEDFQAVSRRNRPIVVVDAAGLSTSASRVESCVDVITTWLVFTVDIGRTDLNLDPERRMALVGLESDGAHRIFDVPLRSPGSGGKRRWPDATLWAAHEPGGEREIFVEWTCDDDRAVLSYDGTAWYVWAKGEGRRRLDAPVAESDLPEAPPAEALPAEQRVAERVEWILASNAIDALMDGQEWFGGAHSKGWTLIHVPDGYALRYVD